jgi:hypothetical protein
MPRRLGISNYHLIWRREFQSCDLDQLRDDPVAMGDLRALESESPTHDSEAQLTDDALLAQLENLLDSGALIALRDGPARGGSVTQPESGTASNDSPAASPAPASRQQPPENPTLPPTNGAAQASSLAAAAASGAPFCEH